MGAPGLRSRDQLNRLKKARGFEGLTSTNTWDAITDAATNRYRSQYEYDANGNIKSVERYDADENHYDDFSYKYEKRGNRVVRNRLYQLNDLADEDDDWVNEAGGAKDIGWTGDVAFNDEDPNMNTAYNYGYDALGNLVRDTREGITGIDWTVAGKVRSVTKATGPSLAFAYGASGQRTIKQLGDPDAVEPTSYREHYIRDAQGNIMATYRYTNSSGASLKLNERPLYGSSRLGSLRKEVELHSEPFDPEAANPVQQVDLNYELTDHLGNVCAVVTGRLLDGNGGGTPKQAELISAQGYEPFGSLLPGRNYSSGSYRYLFQGQEHDDEINGSVGTSYAFEYRMHDPRIGRFLSIDPLAAKYPWNSPYAFAENKVIQYIELEGLETAENHGNQNQDEQHGFESGRGTTENPIQLDEFEVSASRSTEIGSSEVGRGAYGGSFDQYKKDYQLPSGMSRHQAGKWQEGELREWNTEFGLPSNTPYEGSWDAWYKTTDYYRQLQHPRRIRNRHFDISKREIFAIDAGTLRRNCCRKVSCRTSGR